MAIADVFIPEMSSDDYFPRAPPPSPEMQPRKSQGLVFDIPAAKFNGIGLDLRRDTFPLDEEDEFPLPRNYPLVGEGSPQKRVCCSPSVVSRAHVTTSFPSLNRDSTISSGFGSYLAALQNPILEEGYVQTNGVLDSATPTTPTLHVPVSTDHILSHSYDLHSIHPHLPHSFEATQLPEVRQTRSRTLDSEALSHDVARPRSRTLDPCYGSANYGEDPLERKRKISIKRKNPDETEGGDPNLQFYFDYSYSSTGSSGADSDWVVVDRSVESTWPMEKKTCCASDPSSVAAISHLNGSFTSPFSEGLQSGKTFPILFQPSRLRGEGVVRERINTPTNQNFVFQSEELLMELDGMADSVDPMECDQMDSTEVDATPRLEGASNSISWGVGKVVDDDLMTYTDSVHLRVDHQAQGSIVEDPVMRIHHRPTHATSQLPSSRHSCMEEYLKVTPKQVIVKDGDTDLDLDIRLGLSKSL